MAINLEQAIARAKQHMNSLSDEERAEIQELDDEEHRRQYERFLSGYNVGECYLCGKDFKTVSKENPCLHWLLRLGKFKPKDIKLISSGYGYHQIAAYLRWCANAERMLANINDLAGEGPDGKILSSTIRWKNVEWSFDCSPNDLAGHGGSHSNFPHYHFQMRIEGRQFINFNDYHLPFNDFDLFALRARSEKGFDVGFGVHGAGMDEAMKVDPELIVNHTFVSDDEEQATYGMSTMIMSKSGPLKGDDIYNMLQESKRTGRTLASLSREFYEKNKAVSVGTIITPSSSVPEITSRTERDRR